MEHIFEICVHTRKKNWATTWAKRLNKVGFTAGFEPVRDCDGNIGHGPGSMGYRVYISGKAVDWQEFKNAVYALEPKTSWR